MRMINQASAHPIIFEGPAPNFFEGGLIGNGAMGVVVNTRPDAIVFHLGHNAIWDQRISEVHKPDILPFRTLFDRIKKISDECRNSLEENEWYRWYKNRMEEAYRHSYPRPFPCGSLYFFFDIRKYEMISYRIDITSGEISIHMRGLEGNSDVFTVAFADMEQDTLYIRCTDADGNGCQPFTAVRLIPYRGGDKENFPSPDWQSSMCFRQLLPAREDMAPCDDDRAFMVTTRISSLPNPPIAKSRVALADDVPLVVSVSLHHDRAVDLTEGAEPLSCEDAFDRTKSAWTHYWECSGISIQRKDLEETWYQNQYFLRLVLKEGTVCPGLFGNFLYGHYGTDWHGDYHMNYNTQQVFWSCFLTNHVDLHEPYIHLVENLLPLSKDWAKEQYGLPGAYFPHSAYPVPMSTFPYPTTIWGWELCETPWMVQSLWWHYQYTLDTELLRNRLFEPMKQSVLFLCAYMKRPDADFGDGCFHVFPTVVPELYGLRPHFSHNKDCIVDLALIRFVFNAYLEAVEVLKITDEEAQTAAEVREILNHFPEYPVSAGTDNVLLSVEASDPEEVQNTPNTCTPVFPGEDPRMEQGEGRELALRTWKRMLTEGGNELVFYALQGARLGALDLDSFARHVRYNRHPNGTLTDRVICSGGRYADDADFDFMRFMGVWTENFSVPAVISNCLIHGHGDAVRLFPNWDTHEAASFSGHRVRGAFLVGASCENGQVTEVTVFAEKDGIFVWENPWTHQTEQVSLHSGEEKVWHN